MPRQNTIQLRKGTLSQWVANNTQVLASGEPAFEVDTLRLKIGDGTTAWSGLNYVGLAGTGTSGYLPKFNSSQGVSNSLIYDDGTTSTIGTVGGTRITIAGIGGANAISEYFSAEANPRWQIGRDLIAGGLAGVGFATSSTIAANGAAVGLAANKELGLYSSNGSSLIERVRITTAGNVGIGMNNPSERIHVSGAQTAIRLNNSLSYDTQLRLTDTASDWSVGINQGNTLGSGVFSIRSFTAGASRLVIDTSGNVGIGTSAPVALLSIGNASIGNSDGHISIGKNNNAGGARQMRIGFDNNFNLTIGDWGGSNATTNPWVSAVKMAYNTPADTFTTTSAGNVGIGLTNPAEKLDVSGNIKVAGANTSLTIAQDDTTTMRMRSAGNLIVAAGSAANVRFLISTTEHARLSDQGRFGIGLAAPSGKLGVAGGVTVGTNYNVSPPTNGMIVEGDVGIGTTTPSYKLNVNPASNSNNGIQILNNSAGTSARSLLSLFNGSYGAEISVGGTSFTTNGFYRQNRLLISGPFITDYVTGQHAFHIGGGGASQDVSGSTFVGLWDLDSLKVFNSLAGGTSTTAGLRLKSTTANGTTDHISFLVGNNGSTEAARVINNGNVGIGTTTPTYKLQVNGSFAASTKSFRINHPSKKDYSLEYGSLESPYHGVRLTGRDKLIKGVGTVSLPVYLKDLIHDDDTLNIQITNIKHGKIIYIDKIDLQNDRFIVKADRAKSLGELQFCWTLTGVRKDVDHLVVEKEN